MRRMLVGALAVAVAGAVAELLGWDLSAWFRREKAAERKAARKARKVDATPEAGGQGLPV